MINDLKTYSQSFQYGIVRFPWTFWFTKNFSLWICWFNTLIVALHPIVAVCHLCSIWMLSAAALIGFFCFGSGIFMSSSSKMKSCPWGKFNEEFFLIIWVAERYGGLERQLITHYIILDCVLLFDDGISFAFYMKNKNKNKWKGIYFAYACVWVRATCNMSSQTKTALQVVNSVIHKHRNIQKVLWTNIDPFTTKRKKEKIG